MNWTASPSRCSAPQPPEPGPLLPRCRWTPTAPHADEFVVCFDLPGVTPDAIELDVERNVLTVKAERRPLPGGGDVQMQVSERPLGVFSRQLFLGDTLDTDHIAADYEAGVLTLRIPVAEKAKPRRIEITGTAA